jgi:hypothetical protein
MPEEESFLIQASLVGQGDTQRRISISEICNKLTELSHKNDRFANKIVWPLVAKGYIKEILNQKFTVTRKGFYHTIKMSGMSPSNFGMVSYEKAKRLSFEVLKHLCKKTIKNPDKDIIIWQIKIGNYLGDYGGATLNQVADILIEEGFIRYLDKKGRIEVTPQGNERGS